MYAVGEMGSCIRIIAPRFISLLSTVVSLVGLIAVEDGAWLAMTQHQHTAVCRKGGHR